ncbi:hypothetical protein D3C86_2154920 [compost metagenome]
MFIRTEEVGRESGELVAVGFYVFTGHHHMAVIYAFACRYTAPAFDDVGGTDAFFC